MIVPFVYPFHGLVKPLFPARSVFVQVVNLRVQFFLNNIISIQSHQIYRETWQEPGNDKNYISKTSGHDSTAQVCSDLFQFRTTSCLVRYFAPQQSITTLFSWWSTLQNEGLCKGI